LTYKENTKEVDKRIITPMTIQEYPPILTKEHTPILIHEHTPTHSGVDPLLTEEYTPTHSGVDPILVDEYYKEHIKKQDKEQDKEIKKEKINKKEKKLSISSSQIEQEFERLWKLYPRKYGDKKSARKKYGELRKKEKVTYEEVENGLYRYLRYIEQQETEEQFIPYAATWFNQQRWENEYISVAPKPKKVTSFLDYYKQDYGGEDYGRQRCGEIIDIDTAYFPESNESYGERRI
jgi:hypothetical protein